MKRLGFAREAIKKDLLYFALPGMIIFCLELSFCNERNGLNGFWGVVWDLIKQPRLLRTMPGHSLIGLALFFLGLGLMLAGQITLGRNYSGTVAIREGHRLITHGLYRYTRNPMYLGLIMAVMGLPVYVASLSGLITSLFLIPVILVRIKLEEELLGEVFQEAYQKYKERTKRLIPFIY